MSKKFTQLTQYLMIKSIKTYFEELFSDQPNDSSNQPLTAELATAALMIEISLADDHIDDDERNMINELLMETFDIEQSAIQDLIDAAEKEVDHAVSLYEFTRLLNDRMSMTERVKVIENLWHVAYADSVLDKYEEYYIRKVADLLYIAHSDYIKAKLTAAG